jgi:hypothetical protein
MSRFKLNPSAVALVAALVGVTACTPAKWRDVQNPHTGDVFDENKTGDINPSAISSGIEAFVVPDRLRGRDNPEQSAEEAPCVLESNDKIRLVSTSLTPAREDEEGLVLVEVIETQQEACQRRRVFVPIRYLAHQPIAKSGTQLAADRYFMIQNLATEKVRIYVRAERRGEAHRLVLEADMIAGENDPARTRRSAVGSYRIESWHKFYEDTQSLFTPWYEPGAPALPLPGASLAEWTKSDYLPIRDGRRTGILRGAFGWYTAKISPNAFAQWTHGTLGWGQDGDRFIKISRDELTNHYSDPRSFGCTRLENAAIALTQDLMPVGARIIKIYAREDVGDAELKRYAGQAPTSQWDWVLSRDGFRSSNPASSALSAQTLGGVKEEDVLERGRYVMDTRPDSVPISQGHAGIDQTGNLYEIPAQDFRGVFLVDEGRLVNYAHPRDLRRGGHNDQMLPSFLKAH